mmetsp:Transcript_91549/g.262199  ORF Transcript_91549/g.262199 Transcript_91549/m.262199 type:complete len:408 (-) Transcript_91549:153-1376(-)
MAAVASAALGRCLGRSLTLAAHSGRFFARLTQVELESAREDVTIFAAMRPTPVTLVSILEIVEPRQLAKFLHTEVPIRYAERIRLIEDGIPEWKEVPDIRDIHEMHLRTFVSLRKVQHEPNLDAFTEVVREAIWEQRTAVVTMARGLGALRQRHDRYSAEFADHFLNDLFLNRIGSNVLMSQYLACYGESTPAGATNTQTGIVDLACDPAKICREVAENVLRVCHRQTGLRPVVRVEAHSAVGMDFGIPRFAYIPSFLRYMIAELLKNSAKATIEIAVSTAPKSPLASEAELSRRPIFIVVCADESRVAIRVSDRAGGIPFSVGSNIWSYLYSTADRGQSELAGYGVGLPLARLYARYLGGSLDLISMPGYGTDAYLMLPRLQHAQLEVVPDIDHEWKFHSLADHCL